jgi:predicted DNA-binding transcriptional regulator YafY
MAKSANQKMRLLYLMQYLNENTDEAHPATVQEMISHLASLGISAERKTIYDDMESLRVFGMDILQVKSKSTGYYVGERAFQLPELKLLVDSVQSSKFITKEKSEDLIRKLARQTSNENSKQLQRQVFIYNRIKADNDAIYSNVDAIHEAIQNNRQIGFKYCEWTVRKELVQKKGGAEYIVSPWALTWDDENYYLVAYDAAAEKIKHYRVDKMQEIRITAEGRLGRENFKDFDLAAFARKTFGMYGGEDRKITLEGENHLVGVVIDRFGTDVMIHPHDQEHFHAGVTVTVSPQFFGWLAGIGKGIRISWPEDVREAYKQYLQGIVDCL